MDGDDEGFVFDARVVLTGEDRLDVLLGNPEG